MQTRSKTYGGVERYLLVCRFYQLYQFDFFFLFFPISDTFHFCVFQFFINYKISLSNLLSTFHGLTIGRPVNCGVLACPHVSVRIRLKKQLFSPFSKKFASLVAFSPVHTYTMNLFQKDNWPDFACLTPTCSLLWAREIINWRHLWISLVWVYIVVTFFKVAETVFKLFQNRHFKKC